AGLSFTGCGGGAPSIVALLDRSPPASREYDLHLRGERARMLPGHPALAWHALQWLQVLTRMSIGGVPRVCPRAATTLPRDRPVAAGLPACAGRRLTPV